MRLLNFLKLRRYVFVCENLDVVEGCKFREFSCLKTGKVYLEKVPSSVDEIKERFQKLSGIDDASLKRNKENLLKKEKEYFNHLSDTISSSLREELWELTDKNLELRQENSKLMLENYNLSKLLNEKEQNEKPRRKNVGRSGRRR